MIKRYLKTIEEVTQALKDGKTVEDKDYKYRLVSGIICSLDKEEQKGCSNWAVGETIFKWAEPYVMEEEVLKLEVGKFYRTRSGNKVIVLNIDKNDTSGFPVRVAVVGCTNTMYFVSRTGGHSNGFTSEWDIVEPLGE